MQLILVKHAMPKIQSELPPKEWQLSAEGEVQAGFLANELSQYRPFILYSSYEIKAIQTARVVGEALGTSVKTMSGLEEFDRPAQPFMSIQEHQRVNKQIFDYPDIPILGKESAETALIRFEKAIAGITKVQPNNIAVICHGTVISLLAQKYNQLDGFELWKKLSCPSYIVLDAMAYELKKLVSKL